MVSVFRPPHTLLNESFRLQFPFVFRRLQSLQLLLPTRPCFLLSFLASLGFRFHGLSPLPLLFLTPAVFAPFRSLQFWVLTTQPLFLPFPLLPVSASQWLPQCSALAFAPSVFPVLSCLVSRAFFPGSGTQLRCMFPFALPRFAPTAVPRVLAFSFLPAFSVSGPASFRPLTLYFRLLSLLLLPFRSSRFCLTVASPVHRPRFRSFGFLHLSCLISHAFLPDFRTWLSDGFLSSCPASLPQLFHR